MAAQGYEEVCVVCGEVVSGDMQVHLLSKCKVAEKDDQEPINDDSLTLSSSLSTKTVHVRFLFKPLTPLSFKTVTLLSAFNSVDLTSNGMNYTSELSTVPLGEFDGQLILGNSYCYPLKKFMIDQEGETVLLELDPKRMESDQDTTYTYDTGATGTSDTTIRIHYNPSYQLANTGGVTGTKTCPIHGSPLHTLYGDSEGGAYGGGAYGDAAGIEGSGQQKVYAILYYPQSGEDMYTPITSSSYTTSSLKAITQKQTVNSETPPSSDSESTTPTGAMSEEFSRQLSEEGFSPAKVKSKGGRTVMSSSLPVSSKQTAAPSSKKPHAKSITSSSKSDVQTGSLSATSSTTTTQETHQSTGFAISDIKSVGDEMTLQEENRRLKSDLERVSAQWEGRVRRLEAKLKQLSSTEPAGTNEMLGDNDERLDELEDTVERLRCEIQEKENELDMKEKELVESKDRITALENQMVEYATLMNDQSKVIQSTHQQSQHSAKVQELYQKSMEYSKKQQVEFQEKLSSLEAKIIEITEANKETFSLHEILDKLKFDVEEYRVQTKALLKDISDRDDVIKLLEGKLRSKSTTEFESLEVDTLHEKCDAWRSRAEDLGKEMEELKSLLAELAKEKLLAEENLQHHLETSSFEIAQRQLKLEESLKKTKELQEMRVKMESDLHQLRTERTQILEHNAQLIESCDPEKYIKLKKEYASLQHKLQEKEREISKLQETLEFHTASNEEMKEHLETALNEEMLQKIQQRIEKYKKERDAAKDNYKMLKASCDEQIQSLQSQHEAAVSSLEEELHQRESEKLLLMKKVEEYKGKNKMKHQELKHLKTLLEEKNAYIQGYQYEDQIDSSRFGLHDTYDDENETIRKKTTHVSSTDVYIPPVDPSTDSIANIDISLDELSLDKDEMLSHRKMFKRDSEVAHKKLVTVRKRSGEQMLNIAKLSRDNVEAGITVAVKRKDGVFDLGLLRYVGFNDKGEDLCGIELDVPRTDAAGKTNDGTYKDGTKYFACSKGHGLYTPLHNVYEVI